MFGKVTVAQAYLTDINTAAQEIDRVLEQCWTQKKPVYIRLPTDMVLKRLDSTLLTCPLKLDVVSISADLELSIVENILELISTSKSPVVLVDANVSRYRVNTLPDNSKGFLINIRFWKKSISWFENLAS